MDDHGMDMDGAGLDDAGGQPHGAGLPGFDHDGELDALRPEPGPQPGLDDLAGSGDWPGLGYDEYLDPDLAGAPTGELSFAEDYPADGPDYPADGPDDGAGLPDAAGAGEPLFGADPDLPPLADAGLGAEGPFPPALELDPPEPIDGYPWTDPAVLGHDVLPPLGPAGDGPDPAELFEYAGEQPPAGGDGWAALVASPDPATSALARWWSGR